MDYIDDKDKVYNVNDISETGKSSDKENIKQDFLNNETQNENYNSKSVHDEIQSDELQLGKKNFYQNKKNVSELVSVSRSSTKSNFSENHTKNQNFHRNASRMPDQVKCGVICMNII